MRETVTTGRRKASLHELSSEILVPILQLRQSKTITDSMQLRSRAKDLLARFDRGAREAGYQADDIDTAKLALVAFFDEAVFGLEFAEKAQWQENPLGMELLGINYAGVEFFKRLDQCRQMPREKHDVLELLFLCLVLGYKGKYLTDREGLKVLLAELKAVLIRSREGKSFSLLSPRGKPEGEIGKLVRAEIPAWVVLAIAGAVALLFYAVMTLQINSAFDAVVTHLPGTTR